MYMKPNLFCHIQKKCYAWKESCVVGEAGEIGLCYSPCNSQEWMSHIPLEKGRKGTRAAQALTFLGLCVYTFVLFSLAVVILEVLFFVWLALLLLFVAALQINRGLKSERSFKTYACPFFDKQLPIFCWNSYSEWEPIHLVQMPEHFLYNWHLLPLHEGSLNQLQRVTGKEKKLAMSYSGKNDWNQIFSWKQILMEGCGRSERILREKNDQKRTQNHYNLKRRNGFQCAKEESLIANKQIWLLEILHVQDTCLIVVLNINGYHKTKEK